jgi:hypothetical protein
MSDTIVEPTEPTEPVTEPVAPVEPTEPGETLITPPQEPAQKSTDLLEDGTKDGAPETYEDFTLPDGVEVDTRALESFVPVAKQLNLTQDEAQALIDYEAKRVEEFTTAQENSWTELKNEWKTATQSDKEIGGPAFDQSLANAKKFINAYGTNELVEALNATGMGNHPEVIRAFARAGKAMSEDTLAIGGVSNSPRAPEDILYPNQSET